MYNGITMTKGGPSTFDYEQLRLISDLPLYLWRAVQDGSLKKFPNPDAAGHFRVKFRLLDDAIEIDTRLIARLYRSWWARVWFPLQTGGTLSAFMLANSIQEKELNEMDRYQEHQNALNSLNASYPAFIKCVDKRKHSECETEADSNEPETDFKGLKSRFSEITRFEARSLQRFDARHTAAMEEKGDVPYQYERLLTMMMVAYLRDPAANRGIPWVLDDVYLPDFTTTEDTPIEVFHPRRLDKIQAGLGIKKVRQRNKGGSAKHH
jgi:hypothetical protein